MCLECPNYDLCDECWENYKETPPHSEEHETRMFLRPLKEGKAQQIFYAAQPLYLSAMEQTSEQSARELADSSPLDTTVDAALSTKEESLEESQKHVSWPSQGDVASIEEVDRWIVPPTAEEKDESRRKQEAAREAIRLENRNGDVPLIKSPGT